MALPPLDPTGLRSHLNRQHRGMPWKDYVLAATTANLDLDAPGASIDGVTMGYGERFLAKDQTDPVENGIYQWRGAAETAIRDYDMDQDGSTAVAATEVAGAMVRVVAGTVNGARMFATTTTDPSFQLGADDMEWVEVLSSTSLVIPVDHGNMGATETLTFGTNADWHRGTLTANCAITVEGFTVDQGLVGLFEVTQDGTGGWDITWDADVDFGSGADQPNQDPDTVTTFLLWSSVGDSTIYGAKVGAGSLTVEEEGTPLSGAAEILDFVGAGVVASGTGATKTITISGAPAGSAGGDLSGTYPNPSVVDDSHSHTGATVSGFVGAILISDTPSTPLVFADLVQNEAEDDLVYADP